MRVSKQKTIVCFTNSYPYGDKETYFGNELQYLAAAFDQVYIVPTYNPFASDLKRDVPSNVEVLSPLVPVQHSRRVLFGILNMSPIWLYLVDGVENGVFFSSSRLKRWLNSFMIFRISVKRIKKLLNKLNSDTILYSYWAEAPIFTTKWCRSFYKIIRMHRGDFYIEVKDGYLPLRSKIYRSADLLLPISDDIVRRLQTQYSIDPEKIFLNRLGVSNENQQLSPYDNKKITIVSCSRVDPIKRVDLIAKIVVNWKKKIPLTWHHFGDGVEFDRIKKMVRGLSNNANVILHGWTKQSKIYDFYKNNSVSWFINLSVHEGIPVSIMESCSFGIPAIATDVGATSEIISDQNGYLISVDTDIDAIADLISSVNQPGYLNKRRGAYSLWRERFNADDNYRALIHRLSELE